MKHLLKNVALSCAKNRGLSSRKDTAAVFPQGIKKLPQRRIKKYVCVVNLNVGNKSPTFIKERNKTE